MDGILPIYKPKGITSYDVIRVFKKKEHPTYKIGHGGTLDPFADGVLLLLLGRATKKMNELMLMPKSYCATAIIRASSDTLDVTGTIIKSTDHRVPSEHEITEAARSFVGKYDQVVPNYSAAKINGVPRYRLARKGEVIEEKKKLVEIYSLELIKTTEEQVVFFAQVSSGTYIRQLSYDLFKQVGVESYLTELSRTAIGDFSIEKCAQISELDSELWKDKVVTLG